MQVPAHLAELTAAYDHPATLNIDEPPPEEVCAAVECLWLIVRGLRHQLDQLTSRM